MSVYACSGVPRAGVRIEGRMDVVRTCVGCRRREATSSLIRCTAEGVRVVPSANGSHLGRGAWVHPHLECVRRAIAKNAFAWAFRLRVRLDASAVEAFVTEREQAERLMETR